MPKEDTPQIPELQSDSQVGNSTGILAQLLAQANETKVAPTVVFPFLDDSQSFVDSSVETEMAKRKIGKALIVFALAAAVATVAFFYSQLNPNFTFLDDLTGPNISSRFEAGNLELKDRQTKINMLNFRAARLLLDEVNSGIDAYQYQKRVADSTSLLADNFKLTLGSVQKILSQKLGMDFYSTKPVSIEERETLFESLLKTQITKERTALLNDKQPNIAQVRIYDNMLRLVQNKALRNRISSVDFGKISPEDLDSLLAAIRNDGTDELASIGKIRSKRIDWAQIILDIHAVTSKADPHYGQGLFKTVGGFQYSSYKFNSDNGSISISGITKWADNKLFSLIMELIDNINQSSKFKNASFPSMAKNQDENGDFSSSVSLEFELQSSGETDPKDFVTK